MALKQSRSSPSTLGLEDSLRQSWSAGSRVVILSSKSNDWMAAQVVTTHKDWLYCLFDDGETKKVDRYDISIQPLSDSMSPSTTTTGGDGEVDDDLVWFNVAP
jgi:hypothetical protein